MWVNYILTFALLASTSNAVCCFNKNPLCLLSPTCTPNCLDGVSYCDPRVEVCLNDSFGGCIQIVTRTATVIRFPALTTRTSYTTTVLAYSATRVITQYITVQSVYTSRTTQVVSVTEAATITQPGPTITTTARAQGLAKRATTPTVIVTVTTTNNNYCLSNVDVQCTVTVGAASTSYVDFTTTQISTVVNGQQTVITDTSTNTVKQTRTITGSGVTVTVRPGSQPSSQRPATTTGTTATDTGVVVETVVQTDGQTVAQTISRAARPTTTNAAEKKMAGALMLPVFVGQLMLL